MSESESELEIALNKELSQIIKKERLQKKITKYVSGPGKWFLLVLPWVLVIITLLLILSVVRLVDFALAIVFYVVLGLYFINSVMLLLGSSFTEKSLKRRLNFERRRGRPIDSLDGFALLYNNVRAVINLLRLIALLCFVALALFLAMLFLGLLEVGYAAIGFALFGFGLGLLIRSLNLNIHDVNGLSDFYKPTTHQIFLDNFFGDILSNHLDPVTFLKWDDYLKGINRILLSSFIQKVKEHEESELPITFAIEKILFLYYLRFQAVLSEEIFIKELKEVLNVDSKTFDADKGLNIGNSWYFSRKDIYKIFNYINKFNPGFFNIIDRLQLELKDNIERLSKDPIYMESSAQEVVFANGELNIMIYLFNNAVEAKRYRVKIIAPGFDPKEIILDIEVEGRGSFEIPDKQIPLTAPNRKDIVGVLSEMLENGDTMWLTLEPRINGEQTIQVFLESADGIIIEGKTRSVKVTKDIKSQIKKLTSFGSIIGGLAAPLSRMGLFAI